MKRKTKYPNIYYDSVRKKFEYRKMIDGALVFGRAETAEDALSALIDARARNDSRPSSKKKKLPSLNQILDSYLKDRKSELKVTTHYKLQNIINLYIKDRFRKVPVDHLIELDFQKWHRFLGSCDIVTSSKNKYLSILKAIFEYIHIVYDYDCVYVKRLRSFKDYSIQAPIAEFKVFSFDDFRKLYPTLEDYDQLLLMTLFLFGLRSGELLALTRKSVLTKTKTLSIYQSVSWKAASKGYVLIPPKSRTSNRTYPMPDFYFRKLEGFMNANKIEAEGFIFFSPVQKKKPLSSTSLQRKMESWSEIVGYHLHPHLFRHSAVSQLYSKGVKLEEIQRLMGHASSEITKTVYLHQTAESEKALTDFLEAMFRKL